MVSSQKIDKNKLTNHQNYILENLFQLAHKKILIVGDVCVDEYIYGLVKRISPEAPVPVVEVTHQEKRIGLAANVAQNIASLGGEAYLVGVIGADPAAEDLKNLLTEAGVSSEHLITESGRPTTRKSRIMAENNHVVRVDYEHKRFLSAKAENELLAKVAELAPNCDAIIIEDYGKGVLSEKTTQQVIRLAHQYGKKVTVDPHRTTPLSYYRGADLLKPNRDEAFILSGLEIDELREDSNSLLRVAEALKDKAQCKHLVITQGKEGMSIIDEDLSMREIPTYARQVFDVTGAGDTVIAAMTLAWAAGFSLDQSCVLANVAAGVVVGEVGCVPCSQAELLTALQKLK